MFLKRAHMSWRSTCHCSELLSIPWELVGMCPDGKQLPARKQWRNMTQCLKNKVKQGFYLSLLSLLLQIYRLFNLLCYLSVSEQMHSLQALGTCQQLASCWEPWEDFQYEAGQPNNSTGMH